MIINAAKEVLDVRYLRLKLDGFVEDESLDMAQEMMRINTVALAVGADGARVLRGCAADVCILSDMSRTDMLDSGTGHVLIAGATIIERAYLRQHLQDELQRSSKLRVVL